MSDPKTSSEYVVTRSRAHGASRDAGHPRAPIHTLLSIYEEVEILHSLEADSAVLARMPASARERILTDHPDLIIEPNLRYRHHHASGN